MKTGIDIIFRTGFFPTMDSDFLGSKKLKDKVRLLVKTIENEKKKKKGNLICILWSSKMTSQ